MPSSLSTYFAILIGVVLVVYTITEWSLSKKRRALFDKLIRAKTYHCLRCDSVYTSEDGASSANCPKCGYKNGRLKF